MTQFVFSGTVELNGCQFIVEAETEEEAREMIQRGEWLDVETQGAEFVNWEITRRMQPR